MPDLLLNVLDVFDVEVLVYLSYRLLILGRNNSIIQSRVNVDCCRLEVGYVVDLSGSRVAPHTLYRSIREDFDCLFLVGEILKLGHVWTTFEQASPFDCLRVYHLHGVREVAAS